jgi:glycosyltransferase involved in cell wall biosynthesis
MISAFIITYNEEKLLPRCLAALRFCEEIVVFDSYSSDRTVEIARQNGARVVQRKFDNYASQRNEAMKAISSAADWVLMVDADEIVTDELREEILEIAKVRDNPCTLYHVRRKDYFQDKWIKHSSGYPTWFGRLFKNGKVWVERDVNEEYHTDGSKGYLKSHLLHYPFNKGLSYWFEKHNNYSAMEAVNAFNSSKNVPGLFSLFDEDPTIRRQAQKSFVMKLPFRPLIVFILFYVVRGGFLDGSAGYTYCRLRKTYEWMIDLKLKEIRKSRG